MRTIDTARDLKANPFEVVLFRGERIDQATAAALLEVELILGYRLTVTQGIGVSVDASAGTHAEGRVVDLAPYAAADKVAAAKAVGFAPWHRLTIPGLWSEHVHMCLILESATNDRGIAPSAFRQIGSFLRGRDGLKGDAVDSSARMRPQPVYHYDPARSRAIEERGTVTENNVTKARDQLVEAAHALGVAAVKLEATSRRRTVVRAQAAAIRTLRRGVNGVLAALPKS